jgi:hypothetical protein
VSVSVYRFGIGDQLFLLYSTRIRSQRYYMLSLRNNNNNIIISAFIHILCIHKAHGNELCHAYGFQFQLPVSEGGAWSSSSSSTLSHTDIKNTVDSNAEAGIPTFTPTDGAWPSTRDEACVPSTTPSPALSLPLPIWSPPIQSKH